jgi:fibronectin type III domain protein
MTLTWSANAASSNPATNTAGYRLHMGLASGVYTQTTTVGNTTTATVSNLISGVTYYLVVTAYNSAGVDGPPSAQLSYKAP